jgi:hypothetical protein
MNPPDKVPSSEKALYDSRRSSAKLATLLDPAGRVLARGLVQLREAPDLTNSYWPELPSDIPDSECGSACTLEMEGTKLAIQAFQKCAAVSPTRHFHFELKK